MAKRRRKEESLLIPKEDASLGIPLYGEQQVASEATNSIPSTSIGDNYDNGAPGKKSTTPIKNVSKKMLMRELKDAIEKNNNLREQATTLTTEQACDFRHVCSSTLQGETNEIRNESLISSMNNWTLGTLSIPECVPSEGESEIDKKAYEYWKDILVSSLELINTTNEQTKFSVFKIKAGVKLREILHTTSSAPGMPDEISQPFSNALARLNDYYGSRTYILAQRSKLMMMYQSLTESHIEFVRRVASAARLCEYGTDEEMEAIVRVITKGASDSRIRVLAHRNWVKQGTMNDLIALVRDREFEQSNEVEFQKSRERNKKLLVASVSSTYPAAHITQNWRGRGVGRGARRGNQRGGRGFNRGLSHFQNISKCWRCGGIYHRQSECSAIHKECRICGRMGHIARMCSNQQHKPIEETHEIKEMSADRQVAAIENTIAHDSFDKVREDFDDPE